MTVIEKGYPLAERLGRARGSTDPGQVVDDLLGLESIFGCELPGDRLVAG